MDLININVKVAIAYGILMIVFLLVYIAFFKDSPSKKRLAK